LQKKSQETKLIKTVVNDGFTRSILSFHATAADYVAAARSQGTIKDVEVEAGHRRLNSTERKSASRLSASRAVECLSQQTALLSAST